MKKKTPPGKGGASEFRMSLPDRKNYEASRTDLQAAFVANRFLVTIERARLISELAFGIVGHP